MAFQKNKLALTTQANLCAAKILSLFGDTELSVATGFHYKYKSTFYLVTNWHVVTGRHPDTGKPLHSQCAVPNRLRISMPKMLRSSVGEGVRVDLGWKDHTFDLYDATGKNPKWLEHPTLGRRVDAVVMQVGGIESTDFACVNDQQAGAIRAKLLPGMDVFVLGFPKGMTAGGRLPIWKRGSLASEPAVEPDGLPKIFIDTATREGMSGAPVLYNVNGLFWPEDAPAMTAEFAKLGYCRNFLGVYSGRVGDDPFQAQLGIVWKESAIIEIIEGKEPGSPIS